MHLSNPKPDNPLEFIRQHLFGSAIDVEEFDCMKQGFIKLKEDVAQLKADMDRMTQMVSNMMPGPPARAAIEATIQNTSIDSMENNVGNSSHISMPDDSSFIFDETMDQTLVNSDISNETDRSTDMASTGLDSDTINTADNNETADAALQGFTIETVEVDVFYQSKSSLSQSTSTSQSEKSIEKMHLDETNFYSDKMPVMTSTPDHTLSDEDTIVKKSPMDINIDELPIVFNKEDPS